MLFDIYYAQFHNQSNYEDILQLVPIKYILSFQFL